MKSINVLLIAAVAVVLAVSAASATTYRRGDGPTLVWVQIKAKSGETRWQACRRVYQRDVHHVRRGRGNTMWCNIEYHRLYDNDGRPRNYNLR